MKKTLNHLIKSDDMKNRLRKRIKNIGYSWSMFKADIEVDIFLPVWERVDERLFKPLFSYISRFLSPKTGRFLHAWFFSMANRSLDRMMFTFLVWVFLFFTSFITILILDINHIGISIRISIYTALTFLLVEWIIQQYHILRIYGKVKDRYVPSYDRKKNFSCMPLTNGRWIPNNLWFYQHADVSQFKCRYDRSEAQAFIHGEQYSLCKHNIRIYLGVILAFSLLFP